MDQRNLTMLMDFYELTMANGFLESGLGEQIVYFDLFFRKVPDQAGYAIMAGVEQIGRCKANSDGKTCILRRRILRICGGGSCFPKRFCNTWSSSPSPVMCGQFRRVPLCLPTSH